MPSGPATTPCPAAALITAQLRQHLMGEVGVPPNKEVAKGGHIKSASIKYQSDKIEDVIFGKIPPGYYSAQVAMDMKKPDGAFLKKEGISTFFPIEMSVAEIDEQIISAFSNKKLIDPTDDNKGWIGTSTVPPYLTITGYFENDATDPNKRDTGKISTAFPVCDQAQEWLDVYKPKQAAKKQIAEKQVQVKNFKNQLDEAEVKYDNLNKSGKTPPGIIQAKELSIQNLRDEKAKIEKEISDLEDDISKLKPQEDAYTKAQQHYRAEHEKSFQKKYGTLFQTEFLHKNHPIV